MLRACWSSGGGSAATTVKATCMAFSSARRLLQTAPATARRACLYLLIQPVEVNHSAISGTVQCKGSTAAWAILPVRRSSYPPVASTACGP